MPESDNHSLQTGEPEAVKQNVNRSRFGPVRTGLAIVRVAVVAYAALLVGLMLLETRMVYPGAYLSERPPVAVASPANPIVDVHYVSRDGVTLTGRMLDRQGCRNHLLFFHGNASRAKWLDSLARRLSQTFDANVMVAEYRGFDGGRPRPDEEGVLADCLAARDFLCQRQRITPDQILFYGRSLGGACAVAVAADGGAKALILDRTCDGIVEVAARRFPLVPVRWLMRNRFDSAATIAKYHGPIVQLHGTTDEVIPIESGRRLFQAAREPKTWIEVSGLAHNDRLSDAALNEIVVTVNAAVGSDG